MRVLGYGVARNPVAGAPRHSLAARTRGGQPPRSVTPRGPSSWHRPWIDAPSTATSWEPSSDDRRSGSGKARRRPARSGCTAWMMMPAASGHPRKGTLAASRLASPG